MNMNNKLNILWISLEDTSPRYGCYGDPLARTPNLDRLAASGRRYTQGFCTAPVCAPSRFSIITGLYPISAGAQHMRTTHKNRRTPEMPTPYSVVIPHYARLLPEYFRTAGYYCTNNEKTDYQFTSPLTAWDECSPAAHWRNRPDPDQPFFAVFNPIITHESGMWPEKAPPQAITDPDQVKLPPYLPDTPACRRALAQHYDNLAIADQQVGQLLDQLEEDGLAESTLVVHWSDHGEGLPRHKRWPYDAGIRIPLIVRWPGVTRPGEVCDDLVSLIDLAPTMLAAAGQTVPGHLQGQVFVGPRADPPRACVFASRDRYDELYDMIRAARDDRFKYMRNFYADRPYLLWNPYRNRHPIMQEMWRLHLEGKLEGPQALMFQNTRPAEELYDIRNDPFELNNLAADPDFQADLLRLRKACEEWRRTVGDLGEIPESEMVARWHPGGVVPKTAAPIFIPITPTQPGRDAVDGLVVVDGPCLIQLHSATQGASIAWTTEEGAEPKWKLYTQPIRLAAGRHTLRAVAVRVGYEDSAEVSLNLTLR
jgi:arylsulfatase A-like enzyme